jgi:large subunit ribosomal protein L7e
MAPKASTPAPESAVKRAAHKVAQTTAFKAAIAANKAEKKALTKKAYERARDHTRAYRKAAAKLITQRRQAKSYGNFVAEEKPKVAVVVRIRGIAKVAPKQRKVLQLLRLRQIFNAVFVKMNKPIQNMLRLVEPYIAYGYPSLKTVRGLIYKRGHLRVNNNRVKINDNKQIKTKFATDDVVCVEDVVNQIYTAGKHFQKVTNGLWPFKLSPPKGGLRQKRRHFIEGGDFGNRETLINKLLYRMI